MKGIGLSTSADVAAHARPLAAADAVVPRRHLSQRMS